MSIAILGLGHYATSWYFSEFNRRFNLSHGGFSTCPILIYNIDFQRINPYLPHGFEHLTPAIKTIEDEVQHYHIDHWVIPNITFHEALEMASCSLPFSNPLDLAGKKLQKQGISKAIIFGTRFSMKSVYFKRVFQKYAVELIPPPLPEFEWLDEFRTAVYLGENTQEQDAYFEFLVHESSKHDTVIIACTELSTIPVDSEKVLDLAQLQIAEAMGKLS